MNESKELKSIGTHAFETRAIYSSIREKVNECVCVYVCVCVCVCVCVSVCGKPQQTHAFAT